MNVEAKRDKKRRRRSVSNSNEANGVEELRESKERTMKKYRTKLG